MLTYDFEDGVAPRAKMNQQRSRRFRSVQEAKEKEEEKQALLELMKRQSKGPLMVETAEAVVKKAFDSNSITPGTPFMDILAASLRYWCAYKLNTDPAWAKIKVIISDATVPGEGEHKIMDFVRSQRSSPDHDPNTRHVIYGLDADLIMLGLATHEPHFRVLREDVFFQDAKAKLCKLCGQKGHDERTCRGEIKKMDGEFGEQDKPHPLKPFIWLHVPVLREYLAVELDIPGLPFRFDLERAIDDWVFMCFFVGNDFLPHLPALEIRENGIDTLTAIWKDNLPHMGGYLTKDGHVDLDRAQLILAGLAKQEDMIFRRRKETEDRREAGAKRRKMQQANGRGRNQDSYNGRGRNQDSYSTSSGPPTVTHDMVVNRQGIQDVNSANKSAASIMKAQLKELMSTTAKGDGDGSPTTSDNPAPALGKRKAALMEDDAASTSGGPSETDVPSASTEEGPVDGVKLWEEGYADRYYEQKFHVDPKDIEFRHKVGRAYVEGLAWVLHYYFQGCPSWEWYYPYHYAPFAADFVDLGKMKIQFTKGRISRPFEQLMSVLPAASRHAIPEIFHPLMTEEDSPILDFYPEDFEVDLNGKKMAWQGVALLPFIDMPRLLTAMDTKYDLLSPADKARNEVGRETLLFSDAHHDLYDQVTSAFYSKRQENTTLKLDPRKTDGLAGQIEKVDGYLPHGSLVYPLERNALPDVEYDRSIRFVLPQSLFSSSFIPAREPHERDVLTLHSVSYDFPLSSHDHKSMLLRGVKLPTPALNRSDIEILKGKSMRSGRSYGGAPLGQNNYHNGRSQPVNYGPSGGGPRPYQNSRPDRGGYQHGPRNGYGSGGHGPREGQGPRNSYHASPPGRQQPPPPGMPGFGMGVPPPPPPAHVGYGGGYGQGYGQGYSSNPPQRSYSSHYNRPPPPQGPPGQDRNYRPPPRDNRDGNYGHDSRGYR